MKIPMPPYYSSRETKRLDSFSASGLSWRRISLPNTSSNAFTCSRRRFRRGRGVCASRHWEVDGGSCYASADACTFDGGSWWTPGCDSGSGNGCGCCIFHDDDTSSSRRRRTRRRRASAAQASAAAEAQTDDFPADDSIWDDAFPYAWALRTPETLGLSYYATASKGYSMTDFASALRWLQNLRGIVLGGEDGDFVLFRDARYAFLRLALDQLSEGRRVSVWTQRGLGLILAA